jgi:TPR repeat protein
MNHNDFVFKAQEYLKIRADQNDVAAAVLLGEALFHGLAAEVDDRRALGWLTLAGGSDSAGAEILLGDYRRDGRGGLKDLDQAAKIYGKWAERGLGPAQSRLAGLYQLGMGRPQDFSQAAKWYELAAENGDLAAHRVLAQMYLEGLGVPADLAKSIWHYRRAAELGDADSQTATGIFYSLGQGLPQNLNLAVEWWQKAAAQGHEGAKNYLESLAEAHLIVEKKPIKRLKATAKAQPATAPKTPKKTKPKTEKAKPTQKTENAQILA